MASYYVFNAMEAFATDNIPIPADYASMTYVYQTNIAPPLWYRARMSFDTGKAEYWDCCIEIEVPVQYRTQLLLLL